MFRILSNFLGLLYHLFIAPQPMPRTRSSIVVKNLDGSDSSRQVPFFTLSDTRDAIAYYHAHGYCVMRQIIPSDQADRIRRAWDLEVKANNPVLYRQTTGTAMRNIVNDKGWVMNPVLNVHDLDPAGFPSLVAAFKESILQSISLSSVATGILGSNPKVVQSMYFEGNTNTPEHQDSYYLDSEDIGNMVAAWIALEDISVNSGRFYVSQGSHKFDLSQPNISTNVVTSHSAYLDKITSFLRNRPDTLVAPPLRKGDVLFWHPLTIHGSLDSDDAKSSRSSITLHLIPSKSAMRVLRSRITPATTEPDDLLIKSYKPTKLYRKRSRLLMMMAFRAPALYKFSKSTLQYILISFTQLSQTYR